MSPSLPPFLERRSAPPVAQPAHPVQQAWQHWTLRRRWLPDRPAAQGLVSPPTSSEPQQVATAALWFACGFLWGLAVLALAQQGAVPAPVPPSSSAVSLLPPA